MIVASTGVVIRYHPAYVGCLMCICTVLLWYDFALTFTTEVEYIWRGKRSFVAIIFFLGRYGALIGRVFFILSALDGDLSGKVGFF